MNIVHIAAVMLYVFYMYYSLLKYFRVYITGECIGKKLRRVNSIVMIVIYCHLLPYCHVAVIVKSITHI